VTTKIKEFNISDWFGLKARIVLSESSKLLDERGETELREEIGRAINEMIKGKPRYLVLMALVDNLMLAFKEMVKDEFSFEDDEEVQDDCK